MRRLLSTLWIALTILNLTWYLPQAFAESFLLSQSSQNSQASQASQPTILISILEREDCIHCQDEIAFLNELKKTRDDFEVKLIDIYVPENNALWQQVAELQNIPKVTPITLIGNTILQGFDTSETTGKEIEQLIENTKRNLSSQFQQWTFEDLIAAGGTNNLSDTGSTCDDADKCIVPSPNLTFSVPFIGPVDLSAYTLPSLSLILGFIDGFNPCAMWVLVTFLLVLVQIGDRKRMLQVAGLFILAEAIMYYLILNVWYTTWDFIGLDNIVTPIVGIVAIGGGLFFLYEWYTSDGTCKVAAPEKRASTRSRIHAIAQAEMTIATIIAIVALALSVNIIEFACSIGIPQAFTKILDLNAITFIYRQFLMFLYILMYMVDDLIVFGIALYSIEKIGLTAKYSKWCNLFGGILMILLGYLLIFHREILVF